MSEQQQMKKSGDITTQDNHMPSEPVDEISPVIDIQTAEAKDEPILKPQDNHMP
ncbi:hypothetical protein ACX6XY_24120 [Streptomyces sp. O3]